MPRTAVATAKTTGCGTPQIASEAEQNTFDQADKDEPVHGGADRIDAEPAVMLGSTSENSDAKGFSISDYPSAVLVEEQQRQKRKAENGNAPPDETPNVSAKTDGVGFLSEIDRPLPPRARM